jgi:tRNA A58 N-methylase Trm61
MVTLTLVEDDDLEEALYARMRWNVPLSVEHAELLMDRLDVRPGAHVADLGCGWGELLLRVIARAVQAAGTGWTCGREPTSPTWAAAGVNSCCGSSPVPFKPLVPAWTSTPGR